MNRISEVVGVLTLFALLAALPVCAVAVVVLLIVNASGHTVGGWLLSGLGAILMINMGLVSYEAGKYEQRKGR